MGLTLKINIKDMTLRQRLLGMENRMRNLRPVFLDFGERMKRSIEANFQAGGRPAPWPPSKKASGRTLIESSRLKNSIAYVASDQGMVIGTNVPYAAIHQFGGTIRPINVKYLAIPLDKQAAKIRPRDLERQTFVIKSKKGNLLLMERLLKYSGQRGKRFLSKGKFKLVTRPRYLLKDQVNIPQRKFLLFQQEDINYLKMKAAKYIVSGAL